MSKLMTMMALLVFSSFAHSFSGREAWKTSNIKYKVFLLQEYKVFFEQNGSKLSEFEKKVTWFKFINEACAADGLDCIYAGWPSKRINGYCSTPLKNNPEYNKGNCGTQQLHCQPHLFGENICVNVATSEQRSGAFSNCEQKFQHSGRSVEDVIHKAIEKNQEDKILNLLDFADKICTSGAQKGTGMCRRLQAAVLRVRKGITKKNNEKPLPELKRIEPNEIQRKEEVLAIVEKTQAVTEILTVSSENPCPTCDTDTGEVACEPEKDIPFERDTPRPFVTQYGSYEMREGTEWNSTYDVDKNGVRQETGFEFSMRGPNAMTHDPLVSTEHVQRDWRFVTKDHARKDSYLWITDDAGSGFLSQLMESVILIIPRKYEPHAQVVGEEIHVTLTTGEKVIYDKNTKLVKSGVLKEGKVDNTSSRWDRKFAPIEYKGEGISIRTNKRGEDPRLVTDNAVITQNGKTCKVPATQLWDEQSDFRFENDQALLTFLNGKCGNKFSL